MYVLLAERDSYSRFSHGTTHQTIYFPEAKAFHIALPPLPEQERIVGVLGALDDKAEHNRAMARQLERLVSAECGKLLSDAEHDQSLSTVARFINGRAFTKDASGSGRPILRIKELNGGISESTLWSEVAASDENVAFPFDLLFSWSGSLAVYRWGGPTALINQHIFKVLPNDGYPIWLAEHWVRLHLSDFQEIAAGKATTMGHIQRHDLDAARVPVPDPAALKSIRSQIDAMDALRTGLLDEANSLDRARELLLPKLVSGAIRIPNSYDPRGALAGIVSEQAERAA